MSHSVGIDQNVRAAAARAEARLFTTIAMRAKVRLYYTELPTPCADDPELFFDAHDYRRAIAQCGTCPFRGRCGYNAVAVGATHGVWGGIMLPGDYPHKLAPIYTQLRDQFNQRRDQEVRLTKFESFRDLPGSYLARRDARRRSAARPPTYRPGMPRRTNDFQKLIRMLTQLLGEGATVEESKMLTDLVSGEQREVDIYAEGALAGHTVNIGIECRDHQRKQGVEWVEQMHSKHERLPTNLVILVSSSGFYDSAIAKANTYGIKTIAPTRADSDLAAEVATSLGVTMKLWNVTNMSWTMTVNGLPGEWLNRNSHGVVPDDGQVAFYRSDGSVLVAANEFCGAALGQHSMAHSEWVMSDTEREFELETPQMGGPMWHGELLHAYWTVDSEQPVLVPVATMAVKGTVTVVTQAVTVNPSGEIVYDGNSYLTGTAPMEDGQQAQIVIADPQGQRRIRADFPVYIPEPEPENRAARRRRQRGG